MPGALKQIRAAKCAAGLALGLDVAPEAVIPYLADADLALLIETRLSVKGEALDPATPGRRRTGKSTLAQI